MSEIFMSEIFFDKYIYSCYLFAWGWIFEYSSIGVHVRVIVTRQYHLVNGGLFLRSPIDNDTKKLEMGATDVCFGINWESESADEWLDIKCVWIYMGKRGLTR